MAQRPIGPPRSLSNSCRLQVRRAAGALLPGAQPAQWTLRGSDRPGRFLVEGSRFAPTSSRGYSSGGLQLREELAVDQRAEMPGFIEGEHRRVLPAVCPASRHVRRPE